ncbi:FAD-dependent oxidoreductase [soil metagenome]
MSKFSEADEYDAAIIGGGPAGLAAAMWLARYRLRVRVFDDQNARNEATWAVHGYLGLSDPPPEELRRIGREQARAAGAELEAAEVVAVTAEEDRFGVELRDGRDFAARRVLFCTGLLDIIPEIPGLQKYYGSSIWHCPDCDGPGVEGLRIGVIGWGRPIVAFCMEMLTWTDRITLLTHGHEPELPERSRAALERFEIPIRTESVVRLEGSAECVERAILVDGSEVEMDAAFFHIASGPASSLPSELGCEADDDGILQVDDDFRTSVPGAYAAGDITPGSKLAIHAASEGARAAIAIYRSLMPEERRV